MADHRFSDMNFKNLRGRIEVALAEIKGDAFYVGARALRLVRGGEWADF